MSHAGRPAVFTDEQIKTWFERRHSSVRASFVDREPQREAIPMLSDEELEKRKSEAKWTHRKKPKPETEKARGRLEKPELSTVQQYQAAARRVGLSRAKK